MLKEETLEINGKEFIRHYSDTYMIKQIETGILYAEAIDVIPCKFTYEESDTELSKEE